MYEIDSRSNSNLQKHLNVSIFYYTPNTYPKILPLSSSVSVEQMFNIRTLTLKKKKTKK